MNKIKTIGMIVITIVMLASCANKEERVKTIEENAALNIETIAKPEEANIEVKAEGKNFMGVWERTNVDMGYGADIKIVNQTSEGFEFELNAINGGNTGSIEGKAKLITGSYAEYAIAPDEYNSGGKIKFNIENEELIISYDGDYYSLGVGMGVFIDGTYTKGPVNYLNAEIVNETLTSDQQKQLAELLGESTYNSVITIMQYGSRADSQMTYSGFVRGIGEGVDLLFEDNGNIYCLYYTLGYIFYTNDENYKEKLPDAFKEIVEGNNMINFVYKEKKIN